jgi:hypothetical protein
VDAVSEFMARHAPGELDFLRILASNKTVFRGTNNVAGATDFMLAVGECQRRYAGYHIFRSRQELVQKGMDDKIDAGFFTIIVPGHQPSQDEIEAFHSFLET